jgi:hypothetical protein
MISWVSVWFVVAQNRVSAGRRAAQAIARASREAARCAAAWHVGHHALRASAGRAAAATTLTDKSAGAA